MKIPLKEINSGGIEVDFKLSPEILNASQVPEDLSPSFSFESEAQVALNLSREGSTVYVEGVANSSFVSSCSRCVEPSETKLRTPIKIQFKPKSERAAVGEQDEDLEISYYLGKEVELASVVVDFIKLDIPFSVLCAESCKGLCAKCGENLNNENCDCSIEKTGDSPFAVLQGLKLKH